MSLTNFAKTFICVRWISFKNCAQIRGLINGGRRSRTLSKTKPIKNINKYLQSFQRIRLVQRGNFQIVGNKIVDGTNRMF